MVRAIQVLLLCSLLTEYRVAAQTVRHYSLTFLDSSAKTGMLPEEMVQTVAVNECKTEIFSNLFSSLTFANATTNRYDTYFDVGKKKIHFEGKLDSLVKGFRYRGILSQVGSDSIISSFPCKKAIVKSRDGSTVEAVIWYTKKLPWAISPFTLAYESLGGAILDMKCLYRGASIHMKLERFESLEPLLLQKAFTRPDGYTNLDSNQSITEFLLR